MKERPRERLLAEGPEWLTDADLLAIILRVGIGTDEDVLFGGADSMGEGDYD